jgi:outer membrane protein TolC
MKKRLFLIGSLATISIFGFSQQGQGDSVLSVSLKESKEYALANSPLIKSSELDIEAAKKKIWETKAMGLPQISAKFAYSYILTLPGFYDQIIGIAKAQGMNLNPDDMRKTITLDGTVTQLLFSGSYIVGVQTAKVYEGLSELSLSKSKMDLMESVTNSYLLVLVSRENLRLVDSLYLNTNSILESMKVMLQEGFIEETDVDQLQITVNNLKNTSDILKQQVDISERLFKFQIGYPMDRPINLTDSLTFLISDASDQGFLLKNFVVENYIDYKMLDTQKELASLNIKLNKAAFLPDIASFYQHESNFNRNTISFNPPDIVGISVNIPIFSSGMRMAKVSEAKINYEKVRINQQQLSQSLLINYENSKASYLSALNKFNTAKDNLKLSEKIYNRSMIKYKEGTISSIDLTQTQNQYIQSQSNYFNALIDLNSAKLKLEKLISPVE